MTAPAATAATHAHQARLHVNRLHMLLALRQIGVPVDPGQVQETAAAVIACTHMAVANHARQCGGAR